MPNYCHLECELYGIKPKPKGMYMKYVKYNKCMFFLDSHCELDTFQWAFNPSLSTPLLTHGSHDYESNHSTDL